jgi:hypothetical protein
MWEERAWTDVASRDRRFEFEPRGALALIDTEDKEVMLSAVMDIRGIDHLGDRRTVDEAFCLERGRTIVTAPPRQIPLRATEYVQYHWIPQAILRRSGALGNRRLRCTLQCYIAVICNYLGISK